MAMDFFQSQEIARRNTGRLVVLFLLAVAGIVVTVYLAVAAVIIYYGTKSEAETLSIFNPLLMVGVGTATVAVVGMASLYKVAELRSGGRVVAESLGGRLVTPDTGDPTERRLLNVVEEMAIASGTAVPSVYVMEGERGINAF
ncbi:MAG: M48 family metallopeptidase, partial [Planctomycetota bacterium]